MFHAVSDSRSSMHLAASSLILSKAESSNNAAVGMLSLPSVEDTNPVAKVLPLFGRDDG